MLQNDSDEGVVARAMDLIRFRHDARLLKLTLSPGARSILAGSHTSRFRGRGMDFSESRHYQPGDDVRHIDWRVTARTGTTHTKVYIEERERPVFIVIDFSQSIFFGTRKTFKSITAARAASLLAWTAVQHGDRVGAVLVTDEQIYDLKPKAGRRGALALINALVQASKPTPVDGGESLLNKALQHLARVVHPGSLVFLMSDFYTLDETAERLLSRIRMHNDMVAFMLTDPIERTAPAAGQYAVTDGYDTAYLNTIGKQARQRYRKLFADRQNTLVTLASHLDFPAIMLENGQNIRALMGAAFGKNRHSR